MAETGAIAGGALILTAFGALVHGAYRWLKRRDPFVRGVALGPLN